MRPKGIQRIIWIRIANENKVTTTKNEDMHEGKNVNYSDDVMNALSRVTAMWWTHCQGSQRRDEQFAKTYQLWVRSGLLNDNFQITKSTDRSARRSGAKQQQLALLLRCELVLNNVPKPPDEAMVFVVATVISSGFLQRLQIQHKEVYEAINNISRLHQATNAPHKTHYPSTTCRAQSTESNGFRRSGCGIKWKFPMPTKAMCENKWIIKSLCGYKVQKNICGTFQRSVRLKNGVLEKPWFSQCTLWTLTGFRK